jgi:undecaprenyl diphosphate synthase
MNIPTHISIIMDGNGRWASKRGLSRIEGHKKGADVAVDIIKYCSELKIRYLTLFAFSSENWNRPKEEIEFLMQNLSLKLKQEASVLINKKINLRIIGDTTKLPLYLQSELLELMRQTKDFHDWYLTIALSYGGRDEIVRAVKKIAHHVKLGLLDENLISEQKFSEFLDTKHIPDPDLLIRTSGELRLSNFSLWQIAYTEFYFSEILWPDFSRDEFIKAIEAFNGRKRRFGKIN